jgi:hypothetical protein
MSASVRSAADWTRRAPRWAGKSLSVLLLGGEAGERLTHLRATLPSPLGRYPRLPISSCELNYPKKVRRLDQRRGMDRRGGSRRETGSQSSYVSPDPPSGGTRFGTRCRFLAY